MSSPGVVDGEVEKMYSRWIDAEVGANLMVVSRVEETEESGRFLVAARDIAKGEVGESITSNTGPV